MMTSESKFFNQVRSQFDGFSPQVPDEVYRGMRRRLWWSSFMSFNVAQLNVWYVAAFIGCASAGALTLAGGDTPMAREASVISLNLPEIAGAPVIQCQSEPVEQPRTVLLREPRSARSGATADAGQIASEPVAVTPSPNTTGTEVTIPQNEPPVNDQAIAKPEEIELKSLNDQLTSGNGDIHLKAKVYKKQ